MNYDNIVNNVVIKNIDSFGATRELCKQDDTIWVKKYNPIESSNYWENEDTGEIVFEEPTNAVTKHSITMLKDNLSNKIVDGVTFKKGDVLFYLKPTIKPEIDDTIIEDNVTYYIYKVDELKPADIVLLYTVYARTK